MNPSRTPSSDMSAAIVVMTVMRYIFWLIILFLFIPVVGIPSLMAVLRLVLANGG